MGTALSEISFAENPIVYGQFQIFTAERRCHQRYPLHFNVRYRRFSKHDRVSGTGQTVNISSGGLLVSTADNVPVKSRLEISMQWPSVLDGEVPLQMIIDGRVVRSTKSGFAVAILHHEFRTMKRPASQQTQISKAASA